MSNFNTRSVRSLVMQGITLCLLSGALYSPVFAQDTNKENERKKQNNGLPMPNFDFLFGDKNKKKTTNQPSTRSSSSSDDSEVEAPFPMTKKRHGNEETSNGSPFEIQEQESQSKQNRKGGNLPDIYNDTGNSNSNSNNHAGRYKNKNNSEIYSTSSEQDENRDSKRRGKDSNLQIPTFSSSEGRKNSEKKGKIDPSVYDQNESEQNRARKAQDANLQLNPGIYDENGKKKKQRRDGSTSETLPGIYPIDENSKRKKTQNNQQTPVEIYSSNEEDNKKKKSSNQPVNLPPFVYDEDGKKKKSSGNGNLQIMPYDYETSQKKKDKKSSGSDGPVEILPGTDGDTNGNNDTANNGNNTSPFGGPNGVLNSTGLGGIGGLFNPSRMGIRDRFLDKGRGAGWARQNGSPRRLNPGTRRPIITTFNGELPNGNVSIVPFNPDEPFHTGASTEASGNPGQVQNFGKQNDCVQRDISPGQSMWATGKAMAPAYGDRGGTHASAYGQGIDSGVQPDRQPGARTVGKSENAASDKGGDSGNEFGSTMVGSDNVAQAIGPLMIGAQFYKAGMENRPHQNMQEGQAQGMGQSSQIADAAAELGHDQAAQALTYAGSFLPNFTTAGGNKWNQLRDSIFVPMGILLLLPGAMATQVRAIMAQSNPVLGQASPFEGIFRALVALFFIPASYLVMNYGIDISNSLSHTIAQQYKSLFGKDMYNEAMCHEVRAMPFRLPEENRNTIDLKDHSMGQMLAAKERTPFAKLEATLIAVKIWDPCEGLYIVPVDRCQEVVPACVMGCRMAYNMMNASLVTSWNILCAFQCAYLYFLWCVGPLVAGLWTWPMKQFRDAFPNWVEGVLAVCFWALFWNVTVLVMALLRGNDETGTIIMLALNTIANISVKFAFDFAGLLKSSGDEAMQMGDKLADKAGQAGGK